MRLSLRGKLTLLPLLLFALALCVSGGYAYVVARDELRGAVLDSLGSQSRALAYSLDDAATNIVQDLRGIAVIPPVAAILCTKARHGSPRYRNLQAELDYSFSTRTMVENKVYASLDLINEDGIIIASSAAAERRGQRMPRPAAYVRALETRQAQIGPPQARPFRLELPGQPAEKTTAGEQVPTEEAGVTPLVPDASPAGQCYVPFYVPVVCEGRVAGCVVVLVDFARLATPYVSRVNVADAYPIIVGPGGYLMYHPDTTLIMEPVEDPDDMTDPSNLMHQMRDGSLEYEWNNEPWLAMFYTGDATNWTSVVKVNLNVLYQPIHSVLQRMLGMNLLWLIFFALLMCVLVQSLVAALAQTIGYARDVADGQLDKELSVHSGDEVGVLADSLRSMVKSLRTALGRSMAHQEELERISQHKTDFLANMSHEIRTPMNALMGFLTLFRRDNLDEKQRDHMEKINVASRAILQIVNDVLDLSKIEKGKLSLEHTPFRLREALSTLGGIIAFSAEAKGYSYTCRVDDKVPDHVLGDPNRLQQVLFNLLGNAVKFTHQGGVGLVVALAPDTDTVNSHTAGADAPDAAAADSAIADTGEAPLASLSAEDPTPLRLLFEVHDSGIGISEEQIRQLFNPFVQADASITRKFGGTGLGLTISKKLVELMGGHISVQSTPGEGSVFRFNLLLSQVHEAQAHNAQNEVSGGTLPPQTRVLVVEDNDINQEIIGALLESLGLSQISMAEHGQEALERVREQVFDIILMDMQMPVMDGVTATTRLRDMGRQQLPWLISVPIVALTANALSTDVERCRQAGMDGHISKPIMLDVLRETLQTLLEKK